MSAMKRELEALHERAAAGDVEAAATLRVNGWEPTVPGDATGYWSDVMPAWWSPDVECDDCGEAASRVLVMESGWWAFCGRHGDEYAHPDPAVARELLELLDALNGVA